MLAAQPLGEFADHVVVGARLGIGLHHLARHLQESVAAALIDIVMNYVFGTASYVGAALLNMPRWPAWPATSGRAQPRSSRRS